jgi:hypothetical protein
VIVGADVSNSASDASSLMTVVEKVEESTGEKPKSISADSGFSSLSNYEDCAKEGIDCYIPDKNFIMAKEGKFNKEKHRFHKGNFVFDKKENVYICPVGKRLIFYRAKEVNRNGMICKLLYYQGMDCPHCQFHLRCCGKAKYRIIQRDAREHLIDRSRKLLSSKGGQEIYLKRMYTNEPVFAILKHSLGYRHFLLRSLNKVRCEFLLMCIAHNIRKIYKYKQRLEYEGIAKKLSLILGEKIDEGSSEKVFFLTLFLFFTIFFLLRLNFCFFSNFDNFKIKFSDKHLTKFQLQVLIYQPNLHNLSHPRVYQRNL